MGAERSKNARKLGASIAYCVDSQGERARHLSANYSGSVACETYEQIDWSAVDAAFICTPPSVRETPMLSCIAAGIPTFVEKPIGVSAESMAVVAACLNKKPTINAVGYMNRYRSSVQKVRHGLDNCKAIGVSCHWAGTAYSVPWWKNASLSGGPFNEQATHLIDLCRYLLGNIESVAAFHPSVNTDIKDSVAVCLRFHNGCIGTLFYTCSSPEKDIEVVVFSVEKTFRLQGWELRLSGDQPSSSERDYSVFDKETQAFLQAVSTSNQSLIESSFDDAYQTQLTTDAIRFSALSALTRSTGIQRALET